MNETMLKTIETIGRNIKVGDRIEIGRRNLCVKDITPIDGALRLTFASGGWSDVRPNEAVVVERFGDKN